MHQVFDFSAMPDLEKDPVCTYTVFYSDERSADESWAYDEKGIPCFSLCIPVEGNMHRNAGVLTSRESVRGYTCALERLLRAVHAGPGGEIPEDSDLS